MLTVGIAFLVGATGGLGWLRYPDMPGVLVFEAQAVFATATGVTSVRVIDGDTLDVYGMRVRIENIDTPETGKRARCSYERDLGNRATKRLRELTRQGDVRLIPAGDRDRDRFGRFLRRVQVDGQDVGGILIREGLAQPWAGRRANWC